MAPPMLKPYSLLLYLLALITFFFVGISYAGLIEAGKNQGLAGGAIVFGYGVLGAGAGLLIALVLAYRSSRKIIFRINIILAILIAGFYLFYHIKYIERQKLKDAPQPRQREPKPAPGEPTQPHVFSSISAKTIFNYKPMQRKEEMGLGMYAPHLFDRNVLYLYGNLNLEKAIIEHLPSDSITFGPNRHGGFQINTAPPYLVPEHLKLDYDMLYFKATSTTGDFIKIEVNAPTGQTAYVSKTSGRLMYWPEFLLSINSVEFLQPQEQKVHIKPLEYAATVSTPFSFMRPIQVQSRWMQVILLNDHFEPQGKGWIKWNQDGRLLVSYSLLS